MHLPQIIARSAARRPDARLEPVDIDQLVAGLDRPSPNDESLARVVREHAATALAELEVDIDVRAFDPPSVPALYLASSEASSRPVPTASDNPWNAMLRDIAGAPEVNGPRLILNLRSDPVRALGGTLDPVVRRDAVTAIFVLGRLMSGLRLDDRDGEVLSGALRTLLDAATRGGGSVPPSIPQPLEP